MENKISLLHVDDEKDFLLLVKKYFERTYGNIKVTSIIDPHQALEQLETR
ncbi:MAG: hypothetical protein ACFFD4_14335 [Candidatus Odinarchaeota archaeon]